MEKNTTYTSMKKMISVFPDQLQDAIKIGENTDLSLIDKDKILNILIIGLGGSGIGGDYAREICRKTASVPICVSKRYEIPAWVDKNTLIIANSYSGNTEETLASYAQAIEKGAQVICVSSGGKLIEKAKDNNQAFIQVPGNYASPRACLGYSIVSQLTIMEKIGMIKPQWKQEIYASIERLNNEVEDIRQRAGQIALILADKRIIIYAEDSMGPLALRWKQQINENAKTLACQNVVPEMNHNELVGWRDDGNIAVIFLRSKFNLERNAVRMDINKEIISSYAASIIEIYGKGMSFIEQLIYLIHLGDWMSYELAQLKGRDVVEVKVIDYLKSELAKIK